MVTGTALIRMLKRRDELSAEEEKILLSLPARTQDFAARQEIVEHGTRTTESCLILSGFAARSQYLQEGTRQITALHVVGDFVDLHSLLLKVMDHSVVALGPCRVAFVPHQSLRALVEEAPHLGRLLWLSTVIDGAIQRTWITCLGRRSPDQHLAHLICELYLRLEVVGLARDNGFAFPVTQAELGDILGLSLVHVNRKIRDLRTSGLASWQGNVVTILDFEKLKEMAEFDPTYLNLWSEPR